MRALKVMSQCTEIELRDVQILWRHFNFTFLVDDVAPTQGSNYQSRHSQIWVVQTLDAVFPKDLVSDYSVLY